VRDATLFKHATNTRPQIFFNPYKQKYLAVFSCRHHWQRFKLQASREPQPESALLKFRGVKIYKESAEKHRGVGSGLAYELQAIRELQSESALLK
jgi:hypothetical protein